jgi:hypothetical protein
LVGLLFISGSGFSRGILSNVFIKKPFLSKKQRSRRCFGEATNYSFTKTALLLEKPL